MAEEANLPGLLAGPAAEDPRLLQHGRAIAMNPVLLDEVERLSATRQPWTGITRLVAVAAKNELPRIEVQLFGSFVLHSDGELVSKASRKVDRARELAALLILNPKGLADFEIAELMFPEMLRESALHNLQLAAYALRKDLGKLAVHYGARAYQLNPKLVLVADVRSFDGALVKARGATGDALIQALSRALELYRGPLLADAAWHWLEPVRLDYRSRYVSAALQLADVLAPVDSSRSDALAEQALAEAPDTELAYERLIHNARARREASTVRRIVKRYEQAAAQFGFAVNQYFTDETGGISGGRAAR